MRATARVPLVSLPGRWGARLDEILYPFSPMALGGPPGRYPFQLLKTLHFLSGRWGALLRGIL